ncbi:MAG: DUF1993 domain-containing protein [Hyphomicrobiales bacterium]|nr:DUF1993 domain-containing protein [Hyphomicrobiales bacterium]
MYDVSVPVFSERLRALALILTKAEENATERKIDPEVFLKARLAPDMLTLVSQVQIATDSAKGAASRLAGREAPRYEDNEASFAELHARVAKTREYLATFKPEELQGSEDRTVTLKVGGNDMQLKGQKYLLDVAMPNFYFHLTTAYDILRHNGVPLGKSVFLGRA